MVQIIDPCDEPVNVALAGKLDNQEYTITQAFFEYMVPTYTPEPSWCPITYSYQITSVDGDSALTFDAISRTFTFFQDSDLSLSGSDFKDYTVTVIGTAGAVTPV